VTVSLALLAGLILSLLLARVASRKDARAERAVYAIGLLVAALLYLGFALGGGASGKWVTAEAVGVALYGIAALVGFARWPAVLAAGWAAHVGWDVLLHLDGAGAAYTPAWYPWLCVSFDLVIAGAVLAAQGRGRRLRGLFTP
jgi:hypothetical protein